MGVCLMRAAGRLTKKSSWGLGGLSRGRSRWLLAALSPGSTGLRGLSLMSAARCCHLGRGTLGL